MEQDPTEGTCTEVAKRSLDSSTDEEVMLFDVGTSRRDTHIDEKLSAMRAWLRSVRRRICSERSA